MTEYSKKTVKTYGAMMGMTDFRHDCRPADFVTGFPTKDYECSKCLERRAWDELNAGYCPIPDPITMSPAELAFFMRDKIICQGSIRKTYPIWEEACLKVARESLSKIDLSPDAYWDELATPEQWIDAAVKAWESSNE